MTKDTIKIYLPTPLVKDSPAYGRDGSNIYGGADFDLLEWIQERINRGHLTISGGGNLPTASQKYTDDTDAGNNGIALNSYYLVSDLNPYGMTEGTPKMRTL